MSRCLILAAKAHARMAAWLLGVGAVWIVWLGFSTRAATIEVAYDPVLDHIVECREYGLDEAGAVQCIDVVNEWQPFAQERGRCEDRDALVSGYLSKVRPDAKWINGSQEFYLGSPGGRWARLAFRNDSNDPSSDFRDQPAGHETNRPTGVQDWGEWRLRGACFQSRYDTWWTAIYHVPWHHLWRLKTVVGPFDLPEAARAP